MPGGSSSLSPDGAFEIKGLIGQRLIRPTGLPAGWTLKSVTLNGVDVTDTGITIKPNEPVSGIEVTLTLEVHERLRRCHRRRTNPQPTTPS